MVDFTIKNLEVFLTVVERRSFSLAANELYLSQSTVSSAISALEKTLGVQLLVRNARRKVELTEEGERLYPMAKRITESCKELQTMFRSGGGKPTLLIGASSVPAQYLLPDIMSGFLLKEPDCRYVLEAGDSRRVHQMLKKEIIRIGFLGDRIEDPDLTYVPVARDRLVVVTAANGRFSALKEQGVLGRQLLDEPMFAREEGSGTDHAFTRYLRRSGFAPERLQIIARLEHTESIKSMVARGSGIAVLSELTVEEEVTRGELLAFHLEEQALERQIYMAFRRDDRLTEVEKQFIVWVRCLRG